MKVHEVLNLAKPMIEKLVSVDVSPKDIQHLDMFREYMRLKAEGHKIAYIESYICEQYEIKRARFYMVIKKFDMEI